MGGFGGVKGNIGGEVVEREGLARRYRVFRDTYILWAVEAVSTLWGAESRTPAPNSPPTVPTRLVFGPVLSHHEEQYLIFGTNGIAAVATYTLFYVAPVSICP